MAKIKPAKKNAATKNTVADWSKAVPCLFILIVGFLAVGLLLYFATISSVK